SLLATLAQREYLKALVMAFRLNEKPLVQTVYEAVPRAPLPIVYVGPLLRFVAEHMERSPHVEFDLLWTSALLGARGRHLRGRSGEYASVLRALQKCLGDFEGLISRLGSPKIHLVDVRTTAQRIKYGQLRDRCYARSTNAVIMCSPQLKL
ncbi:hypothetical protein BD309DRAFT_985203, partial [Dichomitus squalens]